MECRCRGDEVWGHPGWGGRSVFEETGAEGGDRQRGARLDSHQARTLGGGRWQGRWNTALPAVTQHTAAHGARNCKPSATPALHQERVQSRASEESRVRARTASLVESSSYTHARPSLSLLSLSCVFFRLGGHRSKATRTSSRNRRRVPIFPFPISKERDTPR